jgi:hypothetical protein
MKAWYESKVVWVNLVATIAAVVDIVTQGALIPGAWVPYLSAFVAVLNVVLRVWFTDTPIIK